MSTKQVIVKSVRRLLPSGAVRLLEEGYRRSRVRLVSASYGNPAKHLRVIAVTGTNGKTTTVNYINSILKQAGYKTAMFSTAIIEVKGKSRVNDLNATVATTAQMQRFFKSAKDDKVDFVVLEVTSHALAQHKLSTVPVELAVMTNLTQDHLDYHKTMERYAAAKGILFAKQPRFIVLNKDDKWFDFFNKYPAGEQKITYGESKEADAVISNIKGYSDGSEAKLTLDHQTKLKLYTHMPGEYNVYNAAAAASATYMLGINVKDIVAGLKKIKGVKGRFEQVTPDKSYNVVVDYAHTPDALEKVLTAARGITPNRVILVFGATGDRDKTKRPIMGEIAARLADRIFLTDEESYNEDPGVIRAMVKRGILSAHGDVKTTEIRDRREAIAKALRIARKGDTILITGMGHEQYRIVKGKRIPWNDADVVRSILDKRS